MRCGFTMLELMLAIMILSIMTIVSTLVFRNTVRNWTLATEMADNLQRVDYVVAQVTSALRSAYFRTDGKATDTDGFSLVDGGDEPDESDTIGWTKLGSAIVGRNHKFAKSPHHITLFVRAENDRDVDEYHPFGLIAKIEGEESFRSDDYEEEQEEEEEYGKNEISLGHQIQGFNCRVLDKEQPFNSDNTANWVDKWDTSNCIPRRVQLTFWMKPIEEGKDPYPVTRVVEIPLWDISQNPIEANSDSDSSGKGSRNSNSKSSSSTGGTKSSGTSTGGTGGATGTGGGVGNRTAPTRGGSRLGGGGTSGGATGGGSGGGVPR